MTADTQIPGRTLAEWQSLAAAARRRGEYLDVIDLARQGLLDHPGDPRLEYDKTLAYARAGATGEAEANLRLLRTSGALDGAIDPALRTDYDALAARLLKDRAFAAPDQAAALAHAAATAYEAVYDRTGAYFPAINAATMYRIAGDRTRSEALAHKALALAALDLAALDGDQAAPPQYWPHATMAEAHILLGNHAAAASALQDGVRGGVHLDELASTRRQLEWLAEHGAGDAGILASLPAPYVVTWQTGASRGDPGAIPALVAAHAANGLPVLAYGAVLGPPDIGAAEAFSAAGAQINLVIACPPAGCLQTVHDRFGAGWAARLGTLLAAAASVSHVTLEGDGAEPTVAAMAREQAHGLAAMRATALVTLLHTLRPEPGGAAPPVDEAALPPGLQGRMPRAFVFGDIKGFSTIPEAAHRPFLDHVIGGFADVLATLGSAVEYTETAGDGIFVVLTGITQALRCCDGLQRVMEPGRIAACGLPPTMALRLGAHIGPAARGLDRVTGRQKFIGKEVIRTARIEAVTPVGQTYVTEQFAATLHSQSPVGHACEYVGWQAMAKGFGRCRMYSLRPTPQIIALLHRDEPSTEGVGPC